MSRRAKRIMPWDRLLWGVMLTRSGLLIGDTWCQPPPVPRDDAEPTRTLLFTTRAAARRWCAQKQASYVSRRPSGFRPVRVRECVEVV